MLQLLLPLICLAFCLIKPVLGLLWFLYHRRKAARAASHSANSGTGGAHSPAASSPVSTSKARRQSFVGEILGRSAPEADRRAFALLASLFTPKALREMGHRASLVLGSSRRLA